MIAYNSLTRMGAQASSAQGRHFEEHPRHSLRAAGPWPPRTTSSPPGLFTSGRCSRSLRLHSAEPLGSSAQLGPPRPFSFHRRHLPGAPSKPQGFSFQNGLPPPTRTDHAARPVVRFSARPILLVQSTRAKFHTTGVRVSRPGLLGTSRPLTRGVAAGTSFTRGRFVTGLALLTRCPGKPQGFSLQAIAPPEASPRLRPRDEILTTPWGSNETAASWSGVALLNDEHKAQTSQASGLQRQRANYDNHGQQCQLLPVGAQAPFSSASRGSPASRNPPDSQTGKQNNQWHLQLSPRASTSYSSSGSQSAQRSEVLGAADGQRTHRRNTSKVVGQSVGPL